MIKKLLFTLFLVLSQFIAVAQNIGDYQSAGTGNWTTLSSWERWNGSSWVTPTAGEGYPGENTGTGTVLIQSGHTITIGTANLTTTLMGTVTISGILILDGGSGTGIFTIKTPKIVITPNLSPLAKIEFTNKVTLALQANTVVEVGAGGLPTPGNGTCNNNIEISIGGIPFAYCTGGGGSTPTFADVIASGGTFAANASSNSPVCFGNAINLTGSVSGRIGTTTANGAINGANYTWTTTPSLTVTNANTANATITNAPAGTYDVTLTCVTYYGNQSFSNSKIIKVTVNPLPNAPSVSVTQPTCSTSTGTVTITGVTGETYSFDSGAYSSTLVYSGLAAGSTHTVYAKNANGCISSVTNSTIGAQPGTAFTPTIGTVTQPTFGSNNGSVVLNNLPAGSWTLTQEGPNGTTTITGSGTSTTISGLEAGDYKFSVVEAGACISNFSAVSLITVPYTPTANSGSAATCTGFTASWNAVPTATNYLLDVSTVATFATFVSGFHDLNVGNVITYPVTGLTAGTYYYRIRAKNGSLITLYSNTITYSTLIEPSISVQPVTPVATCSGTGSQTMSVTAAGTGLTYVWRKDGLALVDGGVISGQGTPTLTLTSPLVANAGNYDVIVSGSCSPSVTSSVVIVTVNASTAAPTASATSQPNCLVPTGTITVTAPTGAGISYSINGSDYSNTTGIFDLVAVGDYNVTARNAGGCISSATLVSIIATSTTSWNGSFWNNGDPSLTKAAIIAGNYDTASNPNIVACSLTINSGGTLIIQNEKFVTIQNHLTVNAGGILEIKNQGSLVMINDAGNVTNNGTINVNKTTASFEKYDYTYWSSPLSGSTSIATTFPTWRRAYEFHPENFIDSDDDGFDDNGNDWVRISAMTTPGKGCIIMGPTTGTFPRTESVIFKGTVNNGVVPVPVLLSPGTIDAEDDFNLVGNPYPSAISADAFILANINAGGTINQTIDGTLYFWTHKDDASVTNPGPDAYNYTADDYAMYNLSGGVGTGTASNSKSAVPSGFIASGQGFLVEAVTAGTVTFNNSMRAINPSTANTQFFKTQSVKAKSKAIEKDRFWLNLQNANGMFSQQLVGYFENATVGYDNGYDGSLSDAGNFVNFYSFIDDAAYKIQGREAFNADDQVRLGYFSSVAGTFNINIDSKEGVFNASETPIYLEDKELGIIHDLKEGAYSFETGIGNFNDRFVLRYKSTDKTLGTDESKIADNKFIVSVKERQLKVNSYEDLIDEVWVYDLLGRQIFTKEKVNSNEFVISNLVSAKQTLIVKVLLQNGQTYSNKVVY